MNDTGEKKWLKKILKEEPVGTVEPEICVGGGFADVAGMDNLKTIVTENFVNAIKYPKQATLYNVKPANMLFYGPPGCGKTYFARKIAEEVGVSFIAATPDELGSTYIHGSQQKIRAMFDEAAKKAPTIIFLDEIDALLPDRNINENKHQANETNEFLVMLNDSIAKGIYVIGATNNMENIERAALRPGRFDERVYIGLPDIESRKAMLKYYFDKLPVAEDVNYEALAKQTEGFSCSDIDYAVRKSSKTIFNQAIKEIADDGHACLITQQIVEEVIANLKPSVSKSELTKYEEMRDKYGFGKTSVARRRVGYNIY